MSDVTIKYNNNTIGELNDTGTAVLQTANKKCVSDIEVEYTKSGSDAPAGNIVNITNNSSGTPAINGSGLTTAEGIISINSETAISIPSGNSRMFLYSYYRGDDYLTRIIIYAETDLYSIVVNNTPMEYDNKEHSYIFFQTSQAGPITEQTYNVVITDK